MGNAHRLLIQSCRLSRPYNICRLDIAAYGQPYTGRINERVLVGRETRNEQTHMLPTTNPRKAAPNVLSKDGRPSIPDGDGAIAERGGDERKDCDGTLKVAETGFCLIPRIDWLMLVETVVMRSFVLDPSRV